MNNLIYGNPIYRFKYGRKLLKFQEAGKLPIPRERSLVPVGRNLPATRSSSIVPRGTTSIANRLGRFGRTAGRLGRRYFWPLAALSMAADLNLKRQEISDKLKSGEYILSNGQIIENPNRIVKQDLLNLMDQIDEITNNRNGTIKQDLLNLMDLIDEVTNNRNRTTSSTRMVSPRVKYTVPSEVSDIKATLRMLLDAGYDLGKWKDDGIWGRYTQEAYNKYLLDKTNTPTSELLVLHVISLPNYSASVYLTPSIYDQMSDLTNGFTQQATYQQTPNLLADRSDIRRLINDITGNNPYNYYGYLRKALRNYINGKDYNAEALKVFGDLSKFDPYKASNLSLYKKGGTLISNNVILRFKSNFKKI